MLIGEQIAANSTFIAKGVYRSCLNSRYIVFLDVAEINAHGHCHQSAG